MPGLNPCRHSVETDKAHFLTCNLKQELSIGTETSGYKFNEKQHISTVSKLSPHKLLTTEGKSIFTIQKPGRGRHDKLIQVNYQQESKQTSYAS